MSGAGYDVVVDVDDEYVNHHAYQCFPAQPETRELISIQGDLVIPISRRTWNSTPQTFATDAANARKLPGSSIGTATPATNGGLETLPLDALFYAQFSM